MTAEEFQLREHSILNDTIIAIEDALVNRWNKTYIENIDKIEYEVSMGLLSHQVYLSVHYISMPLLWNDGIGGIICRSIIENIINLSWILKDDSQQRAQMYIKHGRGQEKLQIERLKERLCGLTESSESYRSLAQQIEQREALLSTDQYSFLIDVNVGSWSDKNLRSLAIESGKEDLYKTFFDAFSNATHGTWNMIIKHSMKHSNNPLHRYKLRPYLCAPQSDISWASAITNWMEESFEIFDNHFGYKSTNNIARAFKDALTNLDSEYSAANK